MIDSIFCVCKTQFNLFERFVFFLCWYNWCCRQRWSAAKRARYAIIKRRTSNSILRYDSVLRNLSNAFLVLHLSFQKRLIESFVLFWFQCVLFTEPRPRWKEKVNSKRRKTERKETKKLTVRSFGAPYLHWLSDDVYDYKCAYYLYGHCVSLCAF